MLSTYIQSGPVYDVVGLCDHSVNWYFELGAWKEYPHTQITFYFRGTRMNLCLEISANPCICKCGFLIPELAPFEWHLPVDLMLILSDVGDSPSIINREAL